MVNVERICPVTIYLSRHWSDEGQMAVCEIDGGWSFGYFSSVKDYLQGVSRPYSTREAAVEAAREKANQMTKTALRDYRSKHC